MSKISRHALCSVPEITTAHRFLLPLGHATDSKSSLNIVDSSTRPKPVFGFIVLCELAAACSARLDTGVKSLCPDRFVYAQTSQPSKSETRQKYLRRSFVYIYGEEEHRNLCGARV